VYWFSSFSASALREALLFRIRAWSSVSELVSSVSVFRNRALPYQSPLRVVTLPYHSSASELGEHCGSALVLLAQRISPARVVILPYQSLVFRIRTWLCRIGLPYQSSSVSVFRNRALPYQSSVSEPFESRDSAISLCRIRARKALR